jgi:N-acetylmuramoyl-L-alanine amidase
MESLKEKKYIVIHHSGNSDSIEKIKNVHINVNAWEDIGYHYLIDSEGNVINGRSEEFWGAHVLNHNHNSIGICLIGNFDIDFPSEKQIETLLRLLSEKIEELNIFPENVLGHREFQDVKKTCPGKNVDMNSIRKRIPKILKTIVLS